MNKLLQRTVAAYRPLYLHGLLLDGQYRLPKASPPDAVGAARSGRRSLLTVLSQLVLHPRGSGGCDDDGMSTPAGARHR